MIAEHYQRESSKNFQVHVELTPEQARKANWALGLSGECGEVVELIKHELFGDTPMDKMKLAKELGDLMWYIAATATTYDIPLEPLMLLNIEKLRHRFGGTVYVQEARKNRHELEEKFTDTEVYRLLHAAIERGINP